MKKIVPILLFLATPLLAAEREEMTGTYQLVQHHCPAGISNSIHFGWYDGTGVVKTSQGYLFSAMIAQNDIIIKNGPITVCTGRLTSNRFTGSCRDLQNNFCSVTYEKK